jgi:hypothetical protein
VLMSRVRSVILGLLALTLVGSAMAATASAEAGPFWYHREVGGSKAEKLAGEENFKGTGGIQVLAGKIGGTEIEIEAKSTEAKGKVFNNANQGQIVLVNHYFEPKLTKPATLPNCEVKVGAGNEVAIKGHLMWKWNGTKEQLTEQPQKNQTWDIGFTSIEPPQQKPAVEEVDLVHAPGSFVTITFAGKGGKASECGVLAGSFTVVGSEVGVPNLALGVFSKTLNVRTLSNPQKEKEQIFLQHYWDGEAFQGAKLGLVFGGEPASLVGQTETEAEKQELAVMEK